MKTVAEIVSWCEGAKKEFGDPSEPVGQVFCRYVTDAARYDGSELVFGYNGGLFLKLWPGDTPGNWPVRGLVIPVSVDGPKFYLGELLAFAVKRISADVWHLEPSLNIPGMIHVFVTLYDVPAPAPWESLSVFG